MQPTTVLNSQSSKLALAGRQPLKTPVVQADREQLTQLAFEEFNMTGFFLCDQPVLSLYSVGKITGTVVDLGHCKTGMFLYFTKISAIRLVTYLPQQCGAEALVCKPSAQTLAPTSEYLTHRLCSHTARCHVHC